MPIKNLYLIENKKPTELVQELEKYEIKKLPLSLFARSKVIRKWGSDYDSENREDYGPGNGQSNLSDDERKVMIGVGIGAAVGVSVLTAGLATPIAVKGAQAVIDYANFSSSSSSSNANIGSGNVGIRATEVSKTSSPIWKSLKPWCGEIRTNGLSGSKRSYFTWDYTHSHIEKYNHLGKPVDAISPITGDRLFKDVSGHKPLKL